uniref:Cilium assembly protein DZIP1 N-terminal domain-containing protein n=1 Tax=Neogobius melanostomus TaxID=47308 RepID=A0A8C6S5N0_9GOBI
EYLQAHVHLPSPFQGGIYYPYGHDTHGTHSSAGIPSLLNSPLSQQLNGHCAPGMTPSCCVSTAPPFRFRPRRESVDWRRIIAVDIDAVVSQIDVDALQEHITAVTFCSLDSERCPLCRSPVDPALIKLLRLAQLSVEWLLHCQEFLTLNLHSMEARLEAAGKDREQLLAQHKALEEKIKMLNGELKQRKKLIRNQQLLIKYKYKFLTNNVWCCLLYSENKSEIDRLKSETTNLKEQIVQLQHALQTKAAQVQTH